LRRDGGGERNDRPPPRGRHPGIRRRRPALRAEHLLPLACAAGCALLAASVFMSTFKLAGASPTLETVQHRHHYALILLAVFALLAMAVAIASGSKPAATAVAICGAGALLIFLLIDLPDAGAVGAINDVKLTEAQANPAAGFWLELVGALTLAICGAALATLTSDQLRAFARTPAAGRRFGSTRQRRARRPARKPPASTAKSRARLLREAKSKSR